MQTTQTLKAIAEQLRELINVDNDAPRLIEEYLGEFFSTDLQKENEDLRQEIEDLEDQIEDLHSQLYEEE